MASDKPSQKQITAVVLAMQEIIPFFPKSDTALKLISTEIGNFVSGVDELNWFAHAAVTRFHKFEGLPQLRALYQTKYPPADGIEAGADVPGFTSEDLEAESQKRIMAENDQRYRQALGAPEEEREPFALPEPKRVPDPKKQKRLM